MTTLGHCHPKVTQAVQQAAGQLMNCHDFTTPRSKSRCWKSSSRFCRAIWPGVQMYDNGTTAVEAGLRVLPRRYRASTNSFRALVIFMARAAMAVSLARRSPVNGRTGAAVSICCRARIRTGRGSKRTTGPSIPMRTLRFTTNLSTEATTGQVAGIVLEPIQGWAGSIFPPTDFFPKLRRWCDARGILLMADEVLTGMGRTGKLLAMEHWDTLPDVVTLGKGFGNGFPVTAMVVREPYAESVEHISASTSYGGNPMACAAALASIEAIEEENLLDNALILEEYFLKRLAQMMAEHPIIGDVRCKGCLMGVELVKDRTSKEPFDGSGNFHLQRSISPRPRLDSRWPHPAHESSHRHGPGCGGEMYGHYRRSDRRGRKPFWLFPLVPRDVIEGNSAWKGGASAPPHARYHVLCTPYPQIAWKGGASAPPHARAEFSGFSR